MRAGAAEGAMDASDVLSPALARGELRAIGATTINEIAAMTPALGGGPG